MTMLVVKLMYVVVLMTGDNSNGSYCMVMLSVVIDA